MRLEDLNPNAFTNNTFWFENSIDLTFDEPLFESKGLCGVAGLENKASAVHWVVKRGERLKHVLQTGWWGVVGD